MSGLLQGKVWQSALPARLKPLAAALADIADDDGTNIYPSVAYLAWKLSDDDVLAPRKNERTIQRGIKDLRALGVLEFKDSRQLVERDGVLVPKGGRGRDGKARTTEYRFIEAALPKRRAWSERYAKDANLTGLEDEPTETDAAIVTLNGDTGDGVNGDMGVTQNVPCKRPSETSEEPVQSLSARRTSGRDPDHPITPQTAANFSNYGTASQPFAAGYFCESCSKGIEYPCFDQRTQGAYCPFCNTALVKRDLAFHPP